MAAQICARAAGTDGMTRVKTALRVAKKVQETLPADLIEIAVLDQAGPDKRAMMRGRAIGAEVILVKDAAKTPGITAPYTVQYYQGAASGTGMFYGEEATMTSEEAEALLDKMKDLTDCAPPPGKEEAGDKKGEKKKEAKHEKKPEKKEKKKEGGGHEAAAKEGEGHEAGAKEEAKKEEPKKEEKPEVVFPSDVFGRMQKAAFQKAESAKEPRKSTRRKRKPRNPAFLARCSAWSGWAPRMRPRASTVQRKRAAANMPRLPARAARKTRPPRSRPLPAMAQSLLTMRKARLKATAGTGPETRRRASPLPKSRMPQSRRSLPRKRPARQTATAVASCPRCSAWWVWVATSPRRQSSIPAALPLSAARA